MDLGIFKRSYEFLYTEKDDDDDDARSVLVLKTYKRIESEVVVTMKYTRFLSLRFYRFEVYGKNSTLS